MPESGKAAPKSERLFFALWPDDVLRQQIVRHSKLVVQATKGRAVPAENLHVTLAFLGNVNARQRECICDMADAIVCSPFELRLDCVGHWSRSRVLWLAPDEIPQALNQLAADLHRGAVACSLSLDDRAYRPHLTLLRKSSSVSEELEVDSVRWPVSGFALMRSVSTSKSVRYDVLRQWQFTVAN